MSETKAPTPDDVAKARIYFAEPLDVVDRVLPQMARHVRALLAALDAAERERERDVAGFVSIRKMLRQSPPDVARAILWCDDSLSGYVETQAETEADLSARAAKAERMERERDEAVRSLSDLSRRSTDDIEFLRARAEKDEARVAELEAGLRDLADEYGPSDCRKRCLRLLGPSGSNGGGA